MQMQLRPALAVFLTATINSVSNAAEWKLDPRIAVRAGYNDNIRLSVDDERSSPEINIAPAARFSYETPTSGVSGDLGFEVRRYIDESDFNDEIGRLGLSSFHSMERSRLGFGIELIKDTTLDSQLEETGVVAFDRVDRWRVSLNPTWTYGLNERTSVQLGYTYTDVDYDNDPQSNFSNYTTRGGQLSLSRLLSPRATGTITATYQQTDNDADIESTYSAVQGGTSYKFSETISASLFAGIRRSEVEATRNTFIPILDENNNIVFVPVSSGTQDDDFGYVFSGTLEKQFLRGHTRFTATRDISNTVSGLPLQVTRLSWNNLYRFTEILSGELRLSYYQSEAANGVGERDRNYYELQPTFSWRFKQFWTLSGSYRYREQTFDDSSDEAVQNAAYLTLQYDWPRIAISR
ncbi:MAG: hypothetical protein PVI28_19610 [Gammaproteobacteria bacterium]|jgi:hypothetical protein